MKNQISKLALSLAVVSSFAFAEGAFVGVEGAHAFSSKIKGTAGSIKDSQSGFGFKAGYDWDLFRAYGSYGYAFEAKDKGIKWHSHKFLINADYTPALASNLKLILGGYTGISAINFNSEDSASDVTLGLRLGGEYSLNEKSAIEAGFKADRTKYGVDDGSHVTEKNAGFYLGYNYKF
jgi:hypothetical protein